MTKSWDPSYRKVLSARGAAEKSLGEDIFFSQKATAAKNAGLNERIRQECWHKRGRAQL